MWPLINDNKQQLDIKEKNAKLCNTCFFFEKKFFRKTKKPLITKKKLNSFVYSSKGSL